VKQVVWFISFAALALTARQANAFEGSPHPVVVGDEMSDAMTTSSVSRPTAKSCSATTPASMYPARGFDILSAIAPKQTSAEEATP
jgi:hypothetical protein